MNDLIFLRGHVVGIILSDVKAIVITETVKPFALNAEGAPSYLLAYVLECHMKDGSVKSGQPESSMGIDFLTQLCEINNIELTMKG